MFIKKGLKSRIFSFLAAAAFFVFQVLNGASVVMAEDQNQVTVVVEDNRGVITQGQSTKLNGYDALVDVLGAKGISYDIPDGGYGKYIKTINGVTNVNSSDWKSWLTIVNTNGSETVPQTSIDKTQLKANDKLVVYYGGANTLNVNNIKLSTKAENSPLTISLYNHSDWNPTDAPVKNIKVKVDGGQEKTITDNTISIPGGLNAGRHTLEVSDFRTDSSTPNVAADTLFFYVDPDANVRIESQTGTVYTGKLSGANLLEMLKNAGLKDAEFDNSNLTSLNGIKNNAVSKWKALGKESDSIELVKSSMADYIPKDGENIVLYYGSNALKAMDSLTLSPSTAGENSKVSLKFTSEGSPVSGAVLTVDDYAPTALDANGTYTYSYGLSSGNHRYSLKISDPISRTSYVDKGTFAIDGKTDKPNYLDSAYDSLNNIVNNNSVKSDSSSVNEAINGAVSYIKSQGISNPWVSISFNKLGMKSDEGWIKESYDEIKQDGLSDMYNTDIEKLIMGLEACGYTPYNFAGKNLVSELFNRDINDFQTNDLIFGLLTYNYANIKGNYKITKEILIQNILHNALLYQVGNDSYYGWAYYGTNVDPDLTGAALSALAPYYSEPVVKAAVDNAANTMSNLEDASGYITSQYGRACETNAFGVLGIIAANFDPQSSKFTKTYGNPAKALLSFKGGNGGFKHSLDGSNDNLATEEALRALISLSKSVPYNYYTSSIDPENLNVYGDSGKKQNGTDTKASAEDSVSVSNSKSAVNLKDLPQTGSLFDFKLLVNIGIILIILGTAIIFMKNRSIKKRS